MTVPSGWAGLGVDDLWSPFMEAAAQQGVTIDDLKSFSATDLDAAADEFFAGREIPIMRRGALKSALRQWAVMVGDVELLPLEDGAVVKVFLSQKLGLGGQADVFAGIMCPDGQKVAVKRVYDVSVGEAEHKLLASLGPCPQIVSHMAMVRHRGATWLLMESVEGGTVAEQLCLSGPMSEDETAIVVLDVLRALAHAAKSGVVHRDVKPQNMLCSHGVTKLTDFGLARHDHSKTSQSGLKGTPIYMSSKALRGQFSMASDLHAVGVSAIVMLSGTEQVFGKAVPYPYEPHFAVTAHILAGGLPEVPPSNSKQGRDFIMACMKGDQPAATLAQHPWVASREHLSEITLPPHRLRDNRSRTYGSLSARPPMVEDDFRNVRMRLYQDSMEFGHGYNGITAPPPPMPFTETPVNTLVAGVREFLHKGWALKTSIVDATIRALHAKHLIDLKTLKLANYVDEQIEQVAIDIVGDESISERVASSLKALRKLLQSAIRSEKEKGINRVAAILQRRVAKQMRPWWNHVKHLVCLEQQRREEQNRRRREQQRRDQERKDEELRRQQEHQRRERLQSQVRDIYNFYVSEFYRSSGRRVYVRGNDFHVVMSALELHPHSRRKIGRGVRNIFVANTSYVGSPCFHVERCDGSVEDFSYRKCVELPCWDRCGYDSFNPGPLKPKHFGNDYFDDF